jgi:hypothetical protein
MTAGMLERLDGALTVERDRQARGPVTLGVDRKPGPPKRRHQQTAVLVGGEPTKIGHQTSS